MRIEAEPWYLREVWPVVHDVSLSVSMRLVHTEVIYHPTRARAFIVSPDFYVGLRHEIMVTSFTGAPGYRETMLYTLARAIGWVP